MSLFRWLSVALATLATTSALNAQTAPFSALGLTALFGQESSNEGKRCDAVLTFINALLDPTNDSVQRAWAIIELAQDLSVTSTDELLQRLSSFNTGSEAYFNGINMKCLAGSCAPADYVINAQIAPFGQGFNSQFQGIQAITGLTPAGALTPDLGTQPDSKACCAEAGCCAAVSAAKTCPTCHTTQKMKEDIANWIASLQRLQMQIEYQEKQQCPTCAVRRTAAVKDDCRCVKAGQVQIQACPSLTYAATQQTTVKPVITAGTFACGQASAWPQGTVTMPNGTTFIVPAPSVVTFLDEFQSFLNTVPFQSRRPGDLQTFLDELQSFMNTAIPAHVFNANPVLSAPPVFFAGSAVPPPNPYSTPAQLFPGPMQIVSPCNNPSMFKLSPIREDDPPMQILSPCNNPSLTATAATVSREAPAQPVAKHNVHLVTPYMEAHCERLTSAGNADHIVLEGDVQLMCNRNGQTIRIQGQRVVVHLADGTFTVESAPEVRQAAPVSRVGFVVKPGAYLQTVPYNEVVYPPGPASSAPRD